MLSIPKPKNVFILIIMLSYVATIIKNTNIENYKDKLLAFNIFVLQILLHELEHVIQNKKIDNFNNLESRILYYSNTLEQSLKSKDVYNNFLYNLNPIEIEAEFNSISTIMKLNILTNLQPLYSLFYNRKLHLCTRNYFNNNGTIVFPAYIFFNCDKKYKEVLSFLETMNIKNHRLDQRLSLGLKVSSSEFKKLESKILKLKKA